MGGEVDPAYVAHVLSFLPSSLLIDVFFSFPLLKDANRFTQMRDMAFRLRLSAWATMLQEAGLR